MFLKILNSNKQPLDKIIKASQKQKIEPAYLKSLTLCPDKELQDCFIKYTSKYGIKGSGKSMARAAQVDDIIKKLELCNDEYIKESVKKILNNPNEILTPRKIKKAELLLDSVNCATEKYCTLYTPEFSLGGIFKYTFWGRKFLFQYKIKRKNQEKQLSPKANENAKYLEECVYSEPRKIANFNNRYGIKEKSVINNEVKYFGLRKLLERYPETKEEIEHIWKNYFLEKQPEKIKKVLNQIYKDFGTITCFNEPIPIDKAIYIQDEFNLWKKASNGQAIYPRLLDIREPITMKLERFQPTKTAGSCYKKFQKIFIRNHDDVIGDIGYNVLRHEMAHLNDTNPKKKKVKKTSFMKDEMIKAGISPKHAKYAFKNSLEKKAVFAEGNFKDFSEEYKDEIIKDGLPDWIVNLEYLTPEKYDLIEVFSSKKDLDTIQKIENLFGFFPKKISDEILTSPHYTRRTYKENGTISEEVPPFIGMKIARNLCKKLENAKISPNDFCSKFLNHLGLYYYHGKKRVENHPDYKKDYEHLQKLLENNDLEIEAAINCFKEKYGPFV